MKSPQFVIVAFLLGTAMALKARPATEVKAAEIFGRAEIVPGVPCTNCAVELVGAGFESRTNPSGYFDFHGLVPGVWDVKVIAADTNIPPVQKQVAASGGIVTDTGTILVAKPGSVSGRLNFDPKALVTMLVSVPAQNIVVQPNAKGGYLLQGIAPGPCTVAVLMPGQKALEQMTRVKVGEVTMGVDFPFVLGDAMKYQTPAHVPVVEPPTRNLIPH